MPVQCPIILSTNASGFLVKHSVQPAYFTRNPTAMTNKYALKRGSDQSTVISHRSSVGRKKKIRLDYPIESGNDELETLKRQDTDPVACFMLSRISSEYSEYAVNDLNSLSCLQNHLFAMKPGVIPGLVSRR